VLQALAPGKFRHFIFPITCTHHAHCRCPTECRLSYSEDKWKCLVSLRFTTDAKGQPLGQARNEPFGDVIYDKTEVEDRIRRAQKAILNPSTPYQQFQIGVNILTVESATSSPTGIFQSPERRLNAHNQPPCYFLIKITCHSIPYCRWTLDSFASWTSRKSMSL
jgi:hypothetical protein